MFQKNTKSHRGPYNRQRSRSYAKNSTLSTTKVPESIRLCAGNRTLLIPDRQWKYFDYKTHFPLSSSNHRHPFFSYFPHSPSLQPRTPILRSGAPFAYRVYWILRHLVRPASGEARKPKRVYAGPGGWDGWDRGLRLGCAWVRVKK
ncbi:hypothetical protein E2C01_072509 [Portunus trituberculatus]|uniref:Uncharacterized protein n=1 Tax=Portunus trituberculatus TaxID=210409 RepID=A0A5B7I806_PORTR|nr:hypothetical protein [Portunus trituberculatus]